MFLQAKPAALTCSPTGDFVLATQKTANTPHRSLGLNLFKEILTPCRYLVPHLRQRNYRLALQVTPAQLPGVRLPILWDQFESTLQENEVVGSTDGL